MTRNLNTCTIIIRSRRILSNILHWTQLSMRSLCLSSQIVSSRQGYSACQLLS